MLNNTSWFRKLAFTSYQEKSCSDRLQSSDTESVSGAHRIRSKPLNWYSICKMELKMSSHTYLMLLVNVFIFLRNSAFLKILKIKSNHGWSWIFTQTQPWTEPVWIPFWEACSLTLNYSPWNTSASSMSLRRLERKSTQISLILKNTCSRKFPERGRTGKG